MRISRPRQTGAPGLCAKWGRREAGLILRCRCLLRCVLPHTQKPYICVCIYIYVCIYIHVFTLAYINILCLSPSQFAKLNQHKYAHFRSRSSESESRRSMPPPSDEKINLTVTRLQIVTTKSFYFSSLHVTHVVPGGLN